MAKRSVFQSCSVVWQKQTEYDFNLWLAGKRFRLLKLEDEIQDRLGKCCGHFIHCFIGDCETFQPYRWPAGFGYHTRDRERERETNDMEKNNRNKKGRDLNKMPWPPFLFISWRSKAKSNKNHSGRMEKLMEKKGRRGQRYFTLFSPPGMEQPKAVPTALLAQVNKVLQVLKVWLGWNVFFVLIVFFPQQKKNQNMFVFKSIPVWNRCIVCFASIIF